MSSKPKSKISKTSKQTFLKKYGKKIALGAALSSALAGSAYGIHRYYKHHKAVNGINKDMNDLIQNDEKVRQAVEKYPQINEFSNSFRDAALTLNYPIAHSIYNAKNKVRDKLYGLFGKTPQSGGRKRTNKRKSKTGGKRKPGRPKKK